MTTTISQDDAREAYSEGLAKEETVYLLSNRQGGDIWVGLASNATEATELFRAEANDGSECDESDLTTLSPADYTLCDYRTGDNLRKATSREIVDSMNAAIADGGHGLIKVGDRTCFVS
jgi:hypothetical protein